MDGRKIFLLVAALLVAGTTAFMARSLMTGSAAPQAVGQPVAPVVIDGPEVLVATRALPVGTIIDAAALKFQPWPKELVENAYFLRAGTDMQSVVGTVVRYAIPAGQPVSQGALVKPGDRGFLAAALGPGMRAVTLPVSAQTSVAGFVFPGDRVDVILTQSVAGGGDGPPLKASETMMRNVRVLATDQRTDKGVNEQGNTVVSTYSTVTVEATPQMAERITVAQEVGTLSLSLRSIADNAGELEEAIASGAVDVPADARGERAMLAGLANQPMTGRGSVSTGADVSRFQRSSVPGRGGSGGGFDGAPAPAPMMMATAPQGPAPAGPRPSAGNDSGPTVRVARGNDVTIVPLGGKN